MSGGCLQQWLLPQCNTETPGEGGTFGLAQPVSSGGAAFRAGLLSLLKLKNPRTAAENQGVSTEGTR